MSKQKLTIEVQWSEDSLWGYTDPDEYNQAQSEANWEESLVNHLYDAYPNAEIHVVKGINDRVMVDDGSGGGDDEEPWVDNIVSKVWNGWDWLVA